MRLDTGFRVTVPFAGLLALSMMTVLALPAFGAGSLIISEFRLRGPSGPQDEYIEIYNDSGVAHTVSALSGTGYAIAASDGVARCTIPNNTVIPAHGHWLCTNSAKYSLPSYPSGSGGAIGDASYTADIIDNAGIALFNNTTGGTSFSLANRFDAVGSTSEANTLYKEGTGYFALIPFDIDSAFVRDECGKGGAIAASGPCTISTPKDTDDNGADFYFVDTNGTSSGAGQRLGAPGPQNSASPITPGGIVSAPLDSTAGLYAAPNTVRDFTSDSANHSTAGTVAIRARFTNNTGGSVTRLRLRITDQTTFPAPSGFADLRSRTASSVVVAGINDAATCASIGAPATPPCTVTVQGTTLEEPPNAPNGSAFNSSLSAITVTLGTPLANGASVALQFLFGIQQTGTYRVTLLAEGLPEGGGAAAVYRECDTEVCASAPVAPTVVSITRLDPSPTSASSIRFTVTFSNSVTGVDPSDFTLTSTGSVAPSITGVAGSGTTRTVTVVTGGGAGTIRLDLVDDDTIMDLSANPLGGPGPGNGSFTSGEVYTIVLGSVLAIPTMSWRGLLLLGLLLAGAGVLALRRLI